jgi:hypothetical protein
VTEPRIEREDVGLGLMPPKVGPDPYAHRRGEPRTFAAFWVLYVFATLAAVFAGLGWFGLVAPDVYRPAARVLMVALVAGVWLVWPLVRLSQERPTRPVAAMWADWFLVMAPVCGAIAPQGLPWMAAWTLEACVGMALWIGAWGAIAAGVMAWVYLGEGETRVGRVVVRTGAMVLLVVIALAGPGLELLRAGLVAAPSEELMLLGSPLGGAWVIGAPQDWQGKAVAMTGVTWGAVGVVGAVAMGVWGIVGRRHWALGTGH